MVAMARTSETLIFVREHAKPLSEDTITEVLRPGTRTKKMPRAKAHTPPKARTSHEGELPSIMVTQDSWAPAPPKPRNPRNEATVVRKLPQAMKEYRERARAADQALPKMKVMTARRYNLTLAFVAIGIGLACLYLAPLLSRAIEMAFLALNR